MKTLNISKSFPIEKSSSQQITEYFSKLDFDEPWSFRGYTQKDTNYISHRYHRYPAKFIPQVAARLIKELSEPADLICDPFMGSGTTLVEAKVLGRSSIGMDINPVAYLIAKAKVTSIKPETLEDYWKKLNLEIASAQNSSFKEEISPTLPQNERIDYWFKPETKKSLGIIYSNINEIKNRDVKNFFLCGFSNILKNCSIWLMKSSKPTRDFNKIIPDPYETFAKHIRIMIKRNKIFWNLLQENGALKCSTKPICGDARKIPVEDSSVTLVVTSPPYVTSYEYADLHQLTAIWFGYSKNLPEFRKDFIGSAYREEENIFIGSKIGEDVVRELKEKNTGKSNEVAIYFSEMRESFLEMHRYLKRGGKTCIVIGDTAFKGVNVLNAEVFVEQMLNIGFSVYKIIKREIPSKILPSTRDCLTGRFTSSANHNKTLAYPFEYIIIMEK